MSKPTIHPEQMPLRFLKPVLLKPLLPLMNACLSVLPHAMGRGIQVRRHIITVKPGEQFSAAVIRPLEIRGPLPCFVFYHGGAFMLKAAPHHYNLAKQFALRTPCVVVLPDYRLAPRHPFPTPAEDCYFAYTWTVANAAALGIDAGRIAVCGDSAGVNLAAVVCLMARDRNAPPPCFQMLLYPVTDRTMESNSMRACQKTPMWNARLNKRMWKTYLPGSVAGPLYYASPLEAPSLAGLPGAYLETAELDPLRDEGIAYAEKLREAGVPVQHIQVMGAFHGYDLMKNSNMVKERMQERIAALEAAFRKVP